jgi:type II secretion system protein H
MVRPTPTMTLRTGKILGDGRSARAGFTLIELILVMALLVVIAAIVTPQMSQFFRGRTLENEARRFMTLTRYGQNRAVSEGIPMLVWIDEQNRRYGLEAQPGFLDQDHDGKAVEYELAGELEIEVGSAISTYGVTGTQVMGRNLPANARLIRFQPDGFISDQSPELILIRRTAAASDFMAIGPGRNWQHYEIYTNHVYALR